MTTPLNPIHGPSVVTVVTDPSVIASLTEAMKSVEHLEITYFAAEVFEDGHETYNVYYLANDPDAPPPVVSKRPTAKVPPIATMKRFSK